MTQSTLMEVCIQWVWWPFACQACGRLNRLGPSAGAARIVDQGTFWLQKSLWKVSSLIPCASGLSKKHYTCIYTFFCKITIIFCQAPSFLKIIRSVLTIIMYKFMSYTKTMSQSYSNLSVQLHLFLYHYTYCNPLSHYWTWCHHSSVHFFSFRTFLRERWGWN